METTKTANPVRTMRLGKLGERVDRQAAKEGVKVSALVRRALLAYLDGDQAPAASGERLDELAQQLTAIRSDLARVGGNLNQLAFAFNLGDPITRGELGETHAELQAEFGRLVELLQELRNAIKR